MKIMMNNRQLWRHFAFCLALIISLSACRDDEDFLAENDNIPDPATASRAEQSLDSLFLYAKEVYLWNEALPEYQDFKPRSYTRHSNELDNLKQALFDITQFPLDPASGRSYEFVSHNSTTGKYSYIRDEEAGAASHGSLSSTPLKGTGEDFGLHFTSVAANDIRVRYVTQGSPADKAGLNRGDILEEINGKAVRADSKSDINLINGAIDGQSFSLKVRKADGSTLERTLSKSTYTINPIYKQKVLEAGGTKVGYLAYSMFSNAANSNSHLDDAFAEFAAAGITDLVVDLRYNGGGYVATAEYLCNQIAPSELNGAVMYKELFNKFMQEGKAKILENQVLKDAEGNPIPFRGRNATYADIDYSEAGKTFNFSKKGALETVQNVYFIISERSASASELVINALKPYMNVTLIGATSFGKPVGFFGIGIDKYTVYMSNFLTVNANDEGEYYTGFEPDIPAKDDVTHDFGDPEETCLQMALGLIAPGAEKPNARVTLRDGSTINASTLQIQHLGEADGFQGMIEDRKAPGN